MFNLSKQIVETDGLTAACSFQRFSSAATLPSGLLNMVKQAKGAFPSASTANSNSARLNIPNFTEIRNRTSSIIDFSRLLTCHYPQPLAAYLKPGSLSPVLPLRDELQCLEDLSNVKKQTKIASLITGHTEGLEIGSVLPSPSNASSVGKVQKLMAYSSTELDSLVKRIKNTPGADAFLPRKTRLLLILSKNSNKNQEVLDNFLRIYRTLLTSGIHASPAFVLYADERYSQANVRQTPEDAFKLTKTAFQKLLEEIPELKPYFYISGCFGTNPEDRLLDGYIQECADITINQIEKMLQIAPNSTFIPSDTNGLGTPENVEALFKNIPQNHETDVELHLHHNPNLPFAVDAMRLNKMLLLAGKNHPIRNHVGISTGGSPFKDKLGAPHPKGGFNGNFLAIIHAMLLQHTDLTTDAIQTKQDKIDYLERCLFTFLASQQLDHKTLVNVINGLEELKYKLHQWNMADFLK